MWLWVKKKKKGWVMIATNEYSKKEVRSLRSFISWVVGLTGK